MDLDNLSDLERQLLVAFYVANLKAQGVAHLALEAALADLVDFQCAVAALPKEQAK
jgi:hypothetical protein